MIENYLKGKFKSNIKAKEKRQAIKELFETTDQPPPVLNKVYARERLFPTGIGHGVAIPRYIGEEVKEITLVLGFSKADMEFGALDHKPVRIIWLLLSPEHGKEKYTEILVRLIRLANTEEFKSQVPNLTSYEDLIELVRDLDK
ncbi:MAG: PTS sugar transporter subunit IIA [bacterium]|nr:PTS sugar transporter subunit IIA [bacterium]